jgi:methionyl-tRNA synthetase
MFIKRLDPAKLEEAYGIKCQGVYPWEGVVEPPFGAGWAVVEPGKRTKHHAHQEGETFLIVKGRGIMQMGDETEEVGPGDVLFQPPFTQHTIENPSPSEDLVFVSIYWEDLSLWAGKREAAAPASRPRRALVTAAPPTPNGDLHLGHLSGPYLAADLVTRYLKLRGVEAYYGCGTDDHFSYVKTRAEEMGLAPWDSANQLSAGIRKTMAAAEIEPDLFVRPRHTPSYEPFVLAFFRRLYEEGKLVAKEKTSLWCERCELYLYESHVRGGCPHCGATAGGFCCESCSWPNDGDLTHPVCTHCGGVPVERTFRRLFFDIARYERELRGFYQKVGVNTHLRALLEEILDAGLPEMPVTHVADWGFPVPVAGFPGQVLSVWFETAPRYLIYAQELAERRGDAAGWASFWKDDAAQVVQCFGCDNAFLYAMFIPALLLAYDGGIHLPAAYVMNQFYRLDGDKFSTTRRHLIAGRDMLAKMSADVVRFYLAYTCPEVEPTNFTLAAFEEMIERELVGGWQAWLADLGDRLRQAGGAVPATGDWTEATRRYFERLTDLQAEAAAGYEPRTFSPQQVARALCELARSGRRFGKSEVGWRRVAARSEERRTALALEALTAKILAVAAAPLMPAFAARLWHDLGFETPLDEHRWEERPVWVPAGQRVRGLGGPYFDSVRERSGRHRDRELRSVAS